MTFDPELMALFRPQPGNVNVSITQNRAPTDDSIRLAKEFEEKIWKDVSGRIVMPLHSINAEYVVAEKDVMDRSTHVFFKLNGNPIRIKGHHMHDRHDHIKAIAEKITEAVLKKLLEGKII